DVFPIGRPGRVVGAAALKGKTRDTVAAAAHHINLGISAPVADEGNAAAVGRETRRGVEIAVAGKTTEVGAVGVAQINLVVAVLTEHLRDLPSIGRPGGRDVQTDFFGEGHGDAGHAIKDVEERVAVFEGEV